MAGMACKTEFTHHRHAMITDAMRARAVEETNLKILHVAPAFYPATYWGGPISSMYGLSNALAAVPRVALDILTTDSAGPRRNHRLAVTEFPTRYPPGYHVYFCRRCCGICVSPELVRRLGPMVKAADIVHLHAVYSWPTIPTLIACRLFRKPLVWSVHGALQRWTQSSRPTLKALWERGCLAVRPKRLVVHVTCPKEAEASRLRFPSVEVVMVPHGIEIPEHVAHVGRTDTIRLLYLGRLDPIKGIENLLRACAILDDRGESWSLTVAGTGASEYVSRLMAGIRRSGLRLSEKAAHRHVALIGEASALAKKALFENADMVIVPSYTESFGMVVAEALAHGVPVIASTGTPWARIDEVGCGLCVDNDPESLAKAIEQMSRMPLGPMGQTGRAWMQRQFSWPDRARDIVKLYNGIASSASAYE